MLREGTIFWGTQTFIILCTLGRAWPRFHNQCDPPSRFICEQQNLTFSGVWFSRSFEGQRNFYFMTQLDDPLDPQTIPISLRYLHNFGSTRERKTIKIGHRNAIIGHHFQNLIHCSHTKANYFPTFVEIHPRLFEHLCSPKHSKNNSLHLITCFAEIIFYIKRFTQSFYRTIHIISLLCDMNVKAIREQNYTITSDTSYSHVKTFK